MIIGWKETGTYHLSGGVPCQDSFSWGEKNGASAISLCDGAGSYPQSEIASNAVSIAVAEYAAANFDELYALEDFGLKQRFIALAKQAVEEKNPFLHAKCTLLVFARKNSRSFLLHIGDGGAIGVDEGGTPSVISYPENGASSNITFFLDGLKAEQHLRLKRDVHDHLSSILLCSDGVFGSLYDNAGTIAPAVAIMNSWLRSGNQEAAQEKLCRAMKNIFAENTADDISIIMQSFEN